MPIDKAFKLNLGLQMCLDETNCPVNATILEDVVIPKPFCSNEAIQNFPLDSMYTGGFG